MARILAIILVLAGTFVFGQSVQIDTFRLEKSERFKDFMSDKMYFPIVHSGNKEIDSLINNDMRNRFTRNEYPNESLDSTLLKWAGDQIVFLDFKVTYNQNAILSINVSVEGCGAYCTNWTDYFNYSTQTGKWLDINSVIDSTGLFRKMIIEDKTKQYNKARLELKNAINEPDWGITKEEYNTALKYYNECDNTFMLNRFALYNDSIEIIEECWMPHVMRFLTPIIELKYEFLEIGEYLKINN